MSATFAAAKSIAGVARRLTVPTALLSTIVFFTQNSVNLPELYRPATAGPAAPAAPFNQLDLTDFLPTFQEPKTVVVDVRPRQSYNTGHIVGAVNLDLANGKAAVNRVVETLKTADRVIVYCGDASCIAADLSAAFLADQGLKNVLVYSGGWAEWKSCKLPISRTP